MALLFAGDRLDHNAHEIAPYLRDGHVVLCDRYDLSSIAYQTATARLDDASLPEFEDWIRSLNRYALRPDAVVVIDVDPDVAEERRKERRGALELYEESQLQRKLAELYRDAERLCPGDRILRIDGNVGADAVTAAVCKALESVVDG
jgi:dTMP kinase